jgi:hypothetical protein
VYQATRADAPPPPDSEKTRPVVASSSLVRRGSGQSTRDDEDDEKPQKRKRRRYDNDDDEDDDTPPKPTKRRSRGGGSGWRTINALGVLSCGKMMGAMYAIIGLLFALIQGAFMLLGVSFATRFGGAEAAASLFSWTVCLLVLTPILWGIGGFIGGVIMAFLYNVVAGMIGGIELELE